MLLFAILSIIALTYGLPLIKEDEKTTTISVDNPKVEKHKEIVKKLKSNNLTDIKPAQHLDTLVIDYNGHVNKDLHKELFLADHDELEDLDEKETSERLTLIFKKYKFVNQAKCLFIFKLNYIYQELILIAMMY